VSNAIALEVIDSAAKRGALICFDRNNGFTQVELYRTEITEISINKDTDCYLINKKYMPKKEVVDRFGEAAGVIFTKGETTTLTLEDDTCGKRTVYIGSAQGKVRMSDGTWRMSSVCDYEFDPTLRAMIDYNVDKLTAETRQRKKIWEEKDGTKKENGSTLAIAILEYQKMARQRANTGARLRVIHDLTTVPIALTPEQVSKPIVFGRTVQNTSYLLQTHEGRAMAAAQAFGSDISTLFGSKKPTLESSIPQTMEGKETNNTPEETPEQEPENRSNAADLANQANSEEPEFPDEPTAPAKEHEDLLREKTLILEQIMLSHKDVLDKTSESGKNPYKIAQNELDNPNATIESRSSMTDRLRTWLQAKGYKV
jgi:hypothetical protein